MRRRAPGVVEDATSWGDSVLSVDRTVGLLRAEGWVGSTASTDSWRPGWGPVMMAPGTNDVTASDVTALSNKAPDSFWWCICEPHCADKHTRPTL